MKNRTYPVLLISSACLSFSALAGQGIVIDKIQKQTSTLPSYDEIKDKHQPNKIYRSHDDSVARRGSSGGISGSPIIIRAPEDVSNTISPIDCTHAAYVSLCKELKSYADQHNAEEETPPAPTCNQQLLTGDKWHTKGGVWSAKTVTLRFPSGQIFDPGCHVFGRFFGTYDPYHDGRDYRADWNFGPISKLELGKTYTKTLIDKTYGSFKGEKMQFTMYKDKIVLHIDRGVMYTGSLYTKP